MSRNDHTFTHTLIGDVVHIQRNNEPPIIVPIPAQPGFGPFTGVGAFTYGSPEVVIPNYESLDWVAILPDTSLDIAAAIHSTGLRVHIWETGQGTLYGQAAVDHYQAAGYIGQAENQNQLEASLTAYLKITVPLAIITNVTSLDTLQVPIAITEVYTNANPNASILGLDYEARKRGATKCLPCFGVYSEGDIGTAEYVAKLPLSHYLNELDNLPDAMLALLGSPPSFSFWTAEQLTEQDWQALRDWRSKHAKKAA